MAKARNPVPDGLHTITPHLIFNDSAKAMDWYKKAFGAVEISRAPGPDGRIMHAEMQIGNSRFMMNDEMGGGKSAQNIGGSPVGFWIYTADCDALYKQAVSAGASVPPGPMGQLTDQFWGDRCGTVSDPFGFQWTIATRKEDLTREELDQRAAEFFKQFAQQNA